MLNLQLKFLGQRSCVVKMEILHSQQSRSKNLSQVAQTDSCLCCKKKKCRWEHLKSLCIGYPWENKSPEYWLNAYQCSFWVFRVKEPSMTFSRTLLINKNKFSEIFYLSKLPGANLLTDCLGWRKLNEDISQFSWVLIFTESPIYKQADFSQYKP